MRKPRKAQLLINYTDADKEQYREVLESHGYHDPTAGRPAPSNIVASWVIDPNDRKFFGLSASCRAAMAQNKNPVLSLEELREYLDKEEK